MNRIFKKIAMATTSLGLTFGAVSCAPTPYYGQQPQASSAKSGAKPYQAPAPTAQQPRAAFNPASLIPHGYGVNYSERNGFSFGTSGGSYSQYGNRRRVNYGGLLLPRVTYGR